MRRTADNDAACKHATGTVASCSACKHAACTASSCSACKHAASHSRTDNASRSDKWFGL